MLELPFFKKKSVNEFWHGIRTEFPTIIQMAINTLLPFYTPYLCKVAFSALTITKAKCQLTERNDEDGLQTAVSNSQNGILHVKISRHIHVIYMQICFDLKTG